MKTLDNIKLTELSTEEKMNVNGGGHPAVEAFKILVQVMSVAFTPVKILALSGPPTGGGDYLDGYDSWTHVENQQNR